MHHQMRMKSVMKRVEDGTFTMARCMLRAWTSLIAREREVSAERNMERLSRLHAERVRTAVLRFSKREDFDCLNLVCCGWRDVILMMKRRVCVQSQVRTESQAKCERLQVTA